MRKILLMRAHSSEIIIPYHKFSKSLIHSFSCGIRFKIRFETEDSSERRAGPSAFFNGRKCLDRYNFSSSNIRSRNTLYMGAWDQGHTCH
ncbi:PREDICTED: auxin response factor 3-like [Erythranthe guttata]|uniref:auxin response factor 3-like n=1 Tax=Erythranthe guttata TaxID=4155 RepID=UPI00064DA39B|nr:PREDICTED: auxin response factor 3-like [Erythranthe guttata]|eukprot:XP_012828877.1 PREDICTED: auxin response factor 3-like [Erythranthe guttata]